jgi:hypothetical protein
VADPKNANANVIAFPDLPPKGSPGNGGRRTLMGPEIGTSFDMGQRLFAYYGSGDVFLMSTMASFRPETPLSCWPATVFAVRLSMF